MEEKNTKQKAKPSVDVAACVGCSVCIECCPMDCLELSKPKQHGDIHCYAQLIEGANCIGCGMCAKACPIRIIKMS